MTLEAVHPPFPLFQVNRVGWKIPVCDCMAILMEVEALLPNRCRGKHERPEGTIEGEANLIDPRAILCPFHNVFSKTSRESRPQSTGFDGKCSSALTHLQTISGRTCRA